MVFKPLRILADCLRALSCHQVFVRYDTFPRCLYTKRVAIHLNKAVDEVDAPFAELSYLVLFFYTPEEIKQRLVNGLEVYSITCVLKDVISSKENSLVYNKLFRIGFEKLCKMDTSFREIINKFAIEFVVYENRTQTMKKMLKL